VILQSISSLQTANLRDLLFEDITKNNAIAYGIEGNTATTNEKAIVDVTDSSGNHSVGTVELTFSKEYPASLWPIEEQYVKYDLRLHNIGTSVIQNQTLWMRFTSQSGMTLHESNYLVPLMHSGDYALLHLGPLKMHDSSNHMLFVGINKLGDSSAPNSVSILNSDPATPIDSFPVYSQIALLRMLVGSVLSVSGLGIVILFFVLKRVGKKSVSSNVIGKL